MTEKGEGPRFREPSGRGPELTSQVPPHLHRILHLHRPPAKSGFGAGRDCNIFSPAWPHVTPS